MNFLFAYNSNATSKPVLLGMIGKLRLFRDGTEWKQSAPTNGLRLQLLSLCVCVRVCVCVRERERVCVGVCLSVVGVE